MVCIVSYIRVLVSETLPWPTCARRSKISGQIIENFASTSVGEQSRNSDLGGRAKSEFRPRWESEVGIPTLVGERSRHSDLGGRAKSEFLVKKRAAVLPPREDLHVFPGKNSDLGWRGLGRLEASMPGRGSRLLDGLCCATLHLLRALLRLVQEMICGGGCGCGPGRGITLRRTYSAASWGSWERKAAASLRCCLRSVGHAAQATRDGGRALTVVCQGVGLGVSCQVVIGGFLRSLGTSGQLARPRPWPLRECGSLCTQGRVGVLAGLHEVVQVEVARDERGGLAVRLVQGQGPPPARCSPQPARSVGAG